MSLPRLPGLQECAAALETELRKSKRAEQKLQALLYRLRQDVAEVKQGAELLAKLEDQRSLEYEVDFLTNKVKVSQGYMVKARTLRCALMHAMREECLESG